MSRSQQFVVILKPKLNVKNAIQQLNILLSKQTHKY
ncbi:hypothetical protein HNP25_003314 [Arcicella rosea]|uniref:Uncharacterized protein n=1 Tax=Arcicella rosea TaxID=502909 RepID=A0A841EVI0_9BACT|nr:hypothetical protein [Arcicella rosea]